MRYVVLLVSLIISQTAFSQILFSSGFEDQSYSCWGNRDANGNNKTSCGRFGYIGSWPIQLAGHGYFGFKELEIIYQYNEEEGRAAVAIPDQDVVYVRAYYIFQGMFDFPQGLKLGKVRGPAPGKGSLDIILQSQAPITSTTTQEGINQNVYLGVFHNNAFTGFDWGAVKGYQPFEPGHPYCIEYMVSLNTPGYSNGQVQLWVDGNSIASANNLYMRPSSDWKLNEVRFGSNYSNGGNNNPWPDPANASTLHLDEVVISTSRIGCL